MDEEKPAVTEIPPLKWPGGSKPKRSGFFEFTLNPYKHFFKELAILEKELGARPPIPPEVWGPDPCRQRMGVFISKLIGECSEWETDRFVPDDPLDIVFCPQSLYMNDTDMQICLRVREKVHFDYSWREIPGDQNSLTMADLVDYCLLHANTWPIEEWSPDPTGEICPTFTAFYDLRRFICPRYAIERKAIRPSVPLSMFRLRKRNRKYLNKYIHKRFGKKEVVFNYFLGLFPSTWTWFVLFMSLSFYDVVYCNAPLIYGGTLFTSIVSWIFVYFLSWPKWRKGLHTFRDLVEYVVAESTTKTPVIQGK